MTRAGGVYALEPWDGRHLYYAKTQRDTGIWRVPTGGGEETEILKGPLRLYGDWDLARSGIYYAIARHSGPGHPVFLEGGTRNEYTIQFFDLASGRTTEVFRQVSSSLHGHLIVSPDEQWILYREDPQWQSELMLVENFR